MTLALVDDARRGARDHGAARLRLEVTQQYRRRELSKAVMLHYYDARQDLSSPSDQYGATGDDLHPEAEAGDGSWIRKPTSTTLNTSAARIVTCARANVT